ncbi:MAG TPA: DNA-binding response regulator [Verrucomicrobia bacterium]|nr:DNA-binding response regulator [Verrucomicrobiota bacterium]
MAGERILVIEDEADIQELIRFNLEKENYKVSCHPSGEAGLKAALAAPPDLVLLDLMLPGMDGLSVCRRLRADDKTRDVPVIMLTAKSAEADIVAGLELGADDYITKPFSPRVLLARVRAIRRRSVDVPAEEQSKVLRRGDIEIDNLHHEVRLAGRLVELTLTEFRVLETLVRRPGVVFTRYQIVDAVKGEDYPVTDRSVDVQIVGLRRKLGRHGALIETVRGVGYRFASGI